MWAKRTVRRCVYYIFSHLPADVSCMYTVFRWWLYPTYPPRNRRFWTHWAWLEFPCPDWPLRDVSECQNIYIIIDWQNKNVINNNINYSLLLYYGRYLLLLYSRCWVFYVAVLVWVVVILFLIQLSGGFAFCIDGDTLVEAVHVDAVTSKHKKKCNNII